MAYTITNKDDISTFFIFSMVTILQFTLFRQQTLKIMNFIMLEKDIVYWVALDTACVVTNECVMMNNY